MKMSQRIWKMLVLVTVLWLAGVSLKVTTTANSKLVKPKEKASGQTVSLSDIVTQTKQVVVFQKKGEERKYVGSLAPNSSAFQGFSAAVTEGAIAKETDLNHSDYELVLVGGSSYRLAKYNAVKDILAIYEVQQKDLKPVTIVKLARPLRDLLTSARPLSQPQGTSRTSQESHIFLSGAPPLKHVVRESPLILLGTPVATLDDRYDPEAPSRYKVYLIGVEQYLKDETRLDLPIVVLNHSNYPHDPSPQFGKLYLLFLTPPRGNSVIYYAPNGRISKVVKVFEAGEYDHFEEALLENGKATPVSESYIRDYIPWLKGTEQEVIDRVRAEIRWQQKGRRVR